MVQSSEPSTYRITATLVLHRQQPGDLALLLNSMQNADKIDRWVVIDNGGEGITREAITDAGGIYLRSERNLGFGAGHNRAMRGLLAKSKYHLIVNPDIDFGNGVLEEIYAFMEHHGEIGLVMPRVLYPDGTEQRLCKQLPTPCDLLLRRFLPGWAKPFFRRHTDHYELRDLDMKVPRQIPSLSGCFMFIRSTVLQEIGGFDERYFMYMEDVDLCRRIGEHAQTVFYPNVFITHGYAKGSYRNRKLLWYHLKSACQYFSKWGWIHDPLRVRLNLRTDPIDLCSNRKLFEGVQS